MSFIVVWVILISLCFSTFVRSLDNYTTDSLDALLQDSAFRTLVRHRPPPLTGALYKGMLPTSMAGMDVSVVRLRSRRLWNIGANFSNFQIPSGTRTVPHVKRLAIVYQDLGNWSSQYYNVPGYSLISSVVGFMVFNASNERATNANNIGLSTSGKSIMIHFSDLSFPEGIISGACCVEFSSNGKFHLSDFINLNICLAQDQGHFAIVVPLERKGKKRRNWRLRYLWLWLIGSVLGLGALALVGYSGIFAAKRLKTKKIQVMERKADEDLVLETLWVGGSKMPSAAVTRTEPTLENGSFS